MNSKAASSSSGADSQYEVFLSFCGIDTGKGFTDSLYSCLVDAGISTFRDDDELRVGEELGPELRKVIKDSKILIPIFSKNYASSIRCLRELGQMVECHRNRTQMIFPIFYDVDPYDVRNQSLSNEEAFRLHEKKFDINDVKSWRGALTKVGWLPGIELKKETDRREGDSVMIVVRKVLSKLSKRHILVQHNLVGVEDHIKKLEGLLSVDSEGVRIVGIHGMGGLGKTTIAKVIYNQLSQHFEHRRFLGNVQEILKHHDGIRYLQKQLISRIQMREVLTFSDGMVKDAVRGRKVLIVLDDVNESLPVDMLMGNPSRLGAGSRIIITTRNTKVLDEIERSYEIQDLLRYKPNLMDDRHALQLFNKYAFPGGSPFEGCHILKDSPFEGYHILLNEFVSAAAGLPLALVVLGSSLERKYNISHWGLGFETSEDWGEQLKMLKVKHLRDVLEMLEISFEELERTQKEIFLDIACLFAGRDKTRPCYMWADCDLYPVEGISVLVQHSVITVGDDNKLRMHALLQDLGRQIVSEERSNNLGSQSRLWCKEEAMQILQILERRQGNIGVVQAMCLSEYQDRSIVASDFHYLPNLRYLSLQTQDIDGDFEGLLPNLRWLQCTCVGKFEPVNFALKNLVILDLTLSSTEHLEGWRLFKMAKKLKVLSLSCCIHLKEIRDVPMLKSLERLELEDCRSLYRLEGLEQLISLKTFIASNCNRLVEIEGLHGLISLEELDLGNCRSLKEVPDLRRLKKLMKLSIRFNENITRIHGLEGLKSLKVLDINGCTSIEGLPDILNLEELTKLDVSGCVKLFKFCIPEKSLNKLSIAGSERLGGPLNSPNTKIEMDYVGDDDDILTHDQLRDPGRFWCKKEAMRILETRQGTRNVEALNLDFAAEDLEFHPIYLVHEDFMNLENLKFLNLGTIDLEGDFKYLFWNLRWLKWAPLGSFSPVNFDLRNLVVLDLSYGQITDDWEGWIQIKTAKNLKVLNLSHCYSLTTTTPFSSLATLEQLNLSSCFGLDEIGEVSLGNLKKLTDLDLSNCFIDTGMLDCSKFSNLESLDLHSCAGLHNISGLEGLESLRIFNTSGCQSLSCLPDLSKLKMLRKLNTSGCVKLIEIQGLEELEYLEILDMSGCISMKRLPDISKLEKLEEVKIAKCKNLLEVDSLRDSKLLVRLDMSWCTSLKSVPNLSNFKRLKDLGFGGFKDLKEILGLEGLESLELLDISGCKSIKKLPEMSNLINLKEIYACWCVKLTRIMGLEKLGSLELLDISGCISIEILSDLSNLKGLKVIKASGCLKLSEIRGLEKLESLALLDISGCKSLAHRPNLSNTRIEEFY